MRGLVGGLVWGGVVAGLGLGALSVVAPLPGDGASPGPVAGTPVTEAAQIPAEPGDVALALAAPGADPEPEGITPAETVEPGTDALAEVGPGESAVEQTQAAEGALGADPAPAAGVDPEAEPELTAEAGRAPAPETVPEMTTGTPPVPVPDTEGAELAAPAASGSMSAPLAPGSDPEGAGAQAAPDRPAALAEAGSEAPVQAEGQPGQVEAGTDLARLVPPAASVPAADPPGSEQGQAVARTEPGRPVAPEADPGPVAGAETPPPQAPQGVAAAGSGAALGAEDAGSGDALVLPGPAGESAAQAAPAEPSEAEPGRDGMTAAAPPSPQETSRPADAVPVRRPGAETVGVEAARPGLRTTGVDGVTTGRLPRIAAADPQSPAGPAQEGLDAGSAEPTGAEAPAHIQFARPFENPQAKPVFAIVLRDTGGPEIDREALAALPFPVSFAIDPTLPDAETAALIYRRAGQEVLMLATGLPEGATAADIEVTFGVHAGALEEAVAVLDPEAGGVQGNRALAQQVLAVVDGQGRGVLSWDRGLNAMSQIARRAGMRNAVIFRSLDSEGEAGPVIRRYLDRAAFKAAQDGRVIVAGSTRAETIAAILEWTVEGRADTVALAPVTAAMTSQ